MTDTGRAARQSALWILDQVMTQGRLMADIVAAGGLDKLPPDDRARAQRLATETLRWSGRADVILRPYLRKTPPLPIQNILRLGTIELCQGTAAHGVVDTLVQIASRHRRHGALKGLVNAVLRKVAASGPEAWDKTKAPMLPDWLRDPLREAWGKPAIKGFERAHAQIPPIDLTVASDPDHWADKLIGAVLPTGSVRLAPGAQISTLPGYADGAWWVQDAAAALPAKVLAPIKGERVLDMCAAPGGKTMQLAAMGADVTAVDSSKTRMSRVTENLARTGLKATCLVQDAREMTATWPAILLDAPCSATGTIRRHPDLPFAKDGSGFGALIDLQAEMIDAAWSMLDPGGRLVFCTCSLLPDEGEVQIEEALKRHKDMACDATALGLPGISQDWIDEIGGLRLRPDYWPETGGMDGFYIALLRKAA